MTLKANDLRAEYQYESWFEVVPQVLGGITGMQFDVDFLEDPHVFTYGSGYGGYDGKDKEVDEPEALGVIVHFYSTKTGVTMVAEDKSFGDSRFKTVDFTFQACTLDPGIDQTKH